MTSFWKEYSQDVTELMRDNAIHFYVDPKYLDDSDFIEHTYRALADNTSLKSVSIEVTEHQERLDENNLLLWALKHHQGSIESLEIIGTVFKNVDVLVNLIKGMHHVTTLIIWDYDDSLDAILPLIGYRIECLELHNVKFDNPYAAAVEIMKLKCYVMENVTPA